jgi:hypothetical protein
MTIFQFQFTISSIRAFITPGLFVAGLMLFISCEKVIDVEIPLSAEGIVFEGKIESGSFPYVIISRSAGYFTPIQTSATALAEVLIDSAEVYIMVDDVEYMLDRICLSNLPLEYQQQAQGLLGLNQLPDGYDICIYASLRPELTGVPGKTYHMRAMVHGEEYRSSSKIPELISLDSLWFKLDIAESDTFGYIWAKLNDPDTLGNNYYLATKRLGRDGSFRSVRGAAFDDRLFNGERFDFNMARDNAFGDPSDANEEERGRFRTGDTVVVKLSTIESDVQRFWQTARAASRAGFNPFASPVTVVSNIDNGGRGVWGGYGVTFDTIVCIPVQ